MLSSGVKANGCKFFDFWMRSLWYAHYKKYRILLCMLEIFGQPPGSAISKNQAKKVQGEGAKSFDDEKAWSSIKHSILSHTTSYSSSPCPSSFRFVFFTTFKVSSDGQLNRE
jgi:hypothetical protein